MPTNVYIAYADTYVGKQVLKQFISDPIHYTVHGCVWSRTAAEELTETYAACHFPAFADKAPTAGAAQTEEPAEMESMPPGDSRSTMVPDSAPHPAGRPGAAADKNASHFFFHRRDVAAVRKALLACDWIVMELRQAQDVFEVLSYIQKSSFVKPKRFILLSSFMTWYATPPLTAVAGSDEASADDESDQESVAESVNAPYPPLPPAVMAALDGDKEANDDDEVPAGGEDGQEVLTEDQFNRRMPHVNYFNWRDAERAVAAAHRAEGLPLDTFVLFGGLPYGGEEGPLEPFFRLAWNSASTEGLPVYGTGEQCVPMVHVADLATIIRKLFGLSLSQLPNPSLRYIFATDGANLTWAQVVRAINKGFHCTRPPVMISKESFPLHNHSEYFTVNLRVDSETVMAIMDTEDGQGAESQTWVAKGGFVQNYERVAREFCEARQVTPLRVAVLGPPQVGKTFLSEKLSTFYGLPHFSMEDIIADFEETIGNKREQLASFRQQLSTEECERRRYIKQKRILKAQQRKRYGGGGGGGDDEDEDEDAGGDADDEKAEGQGGAQAHLDEDRVVELTEQEKTDADETIKEAFENSARVHKWRQEIAEMERVLLQRQRVVPPDADAGNPKKKMAPPAKKKPLKDSQKKKEDEIQLVKEGLKEAPFQSKALAYMVRWRVAQPDALNQGYVLDGIPKSVELARLCFSQDDLPAPATEEEALEAFLHPELAAAASGAPADTTKAPAEELASAARLPDHVLVLEAMENYLLDRWTATHTGDAASASALEQFHKDMEIFEAEFINTTYSLLSYFECVSTVAEGALPGGRKPEVHVLSVEDTEPLVPPPPPTSAYAVVPPSAVELAARQVMGVPHNFGKTPLELHQEQVRQTLLLKEQAEKKAQEDEAKRQKEGAAFLEESAVRTINSHVLSDIKRSDLDALEELKAPLREYLMKNVVPLLSKGLLQVCEKRPENPVDFLAEWLLRNNPHDDIIGDL